MIQKRFRRSVLLSLFGLAALSCAFGDVYGCSCGNKPTVLAAYEWSDVVVIARVIAMEKTSKGSVRATTLMVEKTYKGSLKVGEKMVFPGGAGAACIWTFRETDDGASFLLYLRSFGEMKGHWFASTCGRSRHLESAADDLLYLNNRDKQEGRTRISGSLVFHQSSPIEGGESISKALDGVKVKLRSKTKTYDASTNSDGVFEVYDLPPGVYDVEPEVPSNSKIERFGIITSIIRLMMRDAEAVSTDENGEKLGPNQVVLEPKKHAYVDFRFVVDSRIRGTVFDLHGNRLDGVCLKLLPAHGKISQVFWKADCTEDAGAFEIDAIPPGSYIIVVNDDGKISSDEPFRTFYYPNALARERAAVVTIGPGDHLDNLRITAPETHETILVEGSLLYSDNKPVDEGFVSFVGERGNKNRDTDANSKIDANGHFRIKILKGVRGRLFGLMDAYIGEFENCPRIDKAIKRTGLDNAELKTTPISVTGNTNLSGVELKFPFPACKRAP